MSPIELGWKKGIFGWEACNLVKDKVNKFDANGKNNLPEKPEWKRSKENKTMQNVS